MPYPQRYFPGSNFSRDEELGLDERGEKLDGEFRRLSEITNQLNTFLQQISTANAKLKLDQAVLQNDVIDIQTTTASSMTRYTFSQPIDAAVDLVRTFVDGVRVDPSGYDDTGVDFSPAITGELEVKIYFNLVGVLNRIQSITAAEGASYIGYDDAEDRYTADNARDALTECKRELDNFVTAVGDLGLYLLTDGSRTLTGQWDTNERSTVTITPVAATGSFTVSALPVDGDTLTINDGYITQVYEWDDDASVGAGNVPVTIGTDNLDSGAALVTAINDSPIAITAVGVDNATNHDVTLTAQVPGTAANNALASVGSWISAVVGLTGGVDGSFSEALKTAYRIRNHPRSLQDGDVVVHQQLQDVVTEVSLFVSAFLRTDGANQMTANLTMGGNRVVNMGDGVDGTDGATVSQVTAVDDKLAQFVPVDGIKSTDYAAQGNIKGPVALYKEDGGGGYEVQVAADVATNPQSNVATISTISGVPTPSLDDQPTNKLYVDTADTALQTQIDSLGLATIELGGCGLGDTTVGLDISNGGEYQTTGDTTITSAMTPANDTLVRVEAGNLTISNTIDMGAKNPLTLDVDGNIVISNAITAKSLTIRCSGNLTISAAMTLTELRMVVSGTITNTTGSHTILRGRGECAGATISTTWNLRTTPGSTNPADNGLGKYAGTAGDTGSDTGNIGGDGGGGGTGGGDGGPGEAAAPASGLGGGTGFDDDDHGEAYVGINRPWLFEASGGGEGIGTDTGATYARTYAGGSLALYVGGDAVLTGAVFNANGEDSAASGDKQHAGGGGGGAIKIAATGTITDGTATADGGTTTAAAGVDEGGGGGGGSAFFIASAYSGTQTTSAAGGTASGGPSAGDSGVAGSAGEVTLSADDIACLKPLLVV